MVVQILSGLFFVGVLVALYFAGKKVEKAEATPSAEEKKAQLQAEREAEKEVALKEYRNGPVVVSPNVDGEVKEFTIMHITAYGTKYQSAEDALKVCKKLTATERDGLQELIDDMKFLRAEDINAKRLVRKIETPFDGDVHIYKPCKIKIDAPVRKAAGLPARIALSIDEDDDGNIGIGEVYLAANDITESDNRYVFDLYDAEQVKSFTLLVVKNEEYKAEWDEIRKIQVRLEKYNGLLRDKRITYTEDGRVLIAPPTVAQIKAKLKEAESDKKGDMTEEQAKEMIEEIFVSSADID